MWSRGFFTQGGPLQKLISHIGSLYYWLGFYFNMHQYSFRVLYYPGPQKLYQKLIFFGEMPVAGGEE